MITQSTAPSATQAVPSQPDNLTARAEAVAAVAAVAAAAVDRESRFPTEAFAEIRKQNLLGIRVPAALGGEGASVSDIVDICYRIGWACGSTGLIYAMHQVMMACLVPYSDSNPTLEKILRQIATEQLLLASSTTEGLAGGNIRESEAAVQYAGQRISLERKATCISYGMEADGIVTTARRSAQAVQSDQVLLVFLKSAYTLERSVSWDTLGMRGTRSEGFTLQATGDSGNIVPAPYEKIHMRSMVPCAHLFWGAVWAGIAAAAVARAQGFIRAAARHSSSRLPPGAAHLTTAAASLHTLLGLLASSVRKYELAIDNVHALQSLEFQSMITLTKVEASELAVTTVLRAMRACGLPGYRNDSEFSVARHLRDILSSPIMINNDRVLANLGGPTLMTPIPAAIMR
jgi:acyl-CoA dehydrogenase